MPVSTLSWLEACGLGLLGGFLAVFLDIYNLRHVPPSRRPAWLKSPFYWVLTLVRIAAGGVLVWLYVRNGDVLHVFECIYIGASAPLVIKGLLSGAHFEPGTTDLQNESGNAPK